MTLMHFLTLMWITGTALVVWALIIDPTLKNRRKKFEEELAKKRSEIGYDGRQSMDALLYARLFPPFVYNSVPNGGVPYLHCEQWGQQAVVFAIMSNGPTHLMEDIHNFPSDELIAKIRLVL